MIQGFEHVGKDHRCNVCSVDITDGIYSHVVWSTQWRMELKE